MFPSLPVTAVDTLFITAIVAAYLIRRPYTRMIERTTVFKEIESLGLPAQSKGAHAIVCGGSWAGILSARVLLDHFEKVTILESDDFDLFDDEPLRKNIAQSKHNHIMMTLGYNITRKLFPGIREYWEYRGGIHTTLLSGVNYFYGRPTPRVTVSTSETILASRPLMESGVRKKLLSLYQGTGRLEFKMKAVVKGLVVDKTESRTKVVGVRFLNGQEKIEKELRADFVVDATGRSQKGVKWLESLDIVVPCESYDPLVVYHAASYATPMRPEVTSLGDLTYKSSLPWHEWFSSAWPGKTHNTFFFSPGLNGTYTISCRSGGTRKVKPVKDEDSLNEFLQKVYPSPEVARKELLRFEGKRVTDWSTFRLPSCKWFKFEQVDLPECFVAVGDAVCFLNPIYSQGLSCAAVGATNLDGVLRSSSNLDGVSRLHHERLAHRLYMSWLHGLSADYRSAEVAPIFGKSKNDFSYRAFTRFVECLTLASHNDPFVAEVYYRNGCMISLPHELLHPRILWALIKVAITKAVTGW